MERVDRAQQPAAAAGERVAYFDLLRLAASFAVIVLHLSAQHWADVGVDTAAWRAFNLYDGLVRWCVPVFAMISGALFLSRPVSLAKLWRKHIAKIALAFVFWSALYAAVSALRFELTVGQLLSEFVRGHYHLWFLFMIAGLYMLVPLLRPIAQSERLLRYYLLLSFLFAFLLPELAALLALVTNRLGASLQAVLGYADLRFLMGFPCYFLLGYALDRRTIGRGEARVIYALGAAAFVFTVAATRTVSLRLAAPYGLFYDVFSVNVLLEAAAVFTFFKRHPLSGAAARRLVRPLADASFGAYLIHALLIDTLQCELGLDTLSFSPLLAVPALAMLVFTGAYAASLLLRRVPFLRGRIV